HVLTPGTTKTVEANVRFVLPELLVQKAQSAGRNAIVRGQSNYRRTPPHEDIIISILDVGTFSLVDIDTMYEWCCLKRKNSATRTLLNWLETKLDTETRREFISRVSTINWRMIVQFDDITRFAGEMCISDGCVFVAALKVSDSWIHKQDHGRIDQVHVVDSVYLDFQDVKDRERMLDTSQCVLSKAVDSRIVLVPVHITVDVQHWCAAIVDFGSKIIWIYDPKIRNDCLDAIHTIMTEKLVPVVDKTCKLTIRRSSAWHQTDGHNCGVLIIKWF
ncbi:hypothetical protein JG687_00009355, partial [Phytophthora cactorum]